MKDLASILFNVKASCRVPEAGQIMLAQPFLKETFFTHGVVSVIDYLPGEGATGVVLNCASEYKLADLLEDVDEASSVPVFCGGPIGQDRLFFIHTLGDEIIADAREYAPGIFIGGNFDDAVRYVNDGYPVDGYIRFFLGHSSWAEGQLEREIERGTWVCLDRYTDTDALRGTGDAMWHRTVKSMGRDFRAWSLLPRNPVCN